MSGFETVARRAAFVSEYEGLTLTASGIIGSPLSLSGLVVAKRMDEEPQRGKALLYLESLSDSVQPSGLWGQIRQTWRGLLYVPITRNADTSTMDAVRETILTAFQDSTFGGTVWEATHNVAIRLDDAHALVEVLSSCSFVRAPGA